MIDTSNSAETAAVRRAELADAGVIAQIQVESWRAAYRDILPEAFLASMDVEQKSQLWQRGISAKTIRVWLIDAAGTPGGFAAVGKVRDEDLDPLEWGELYAIYVRNSLKGQGFGRRLLETALRDLRNHDFAKCTLWVLADNLSARRFYEVAGFTCDNAVATQTFGGQAVLKTRYRKSEI